MQKTSNILNIHLGASLSRLSRESYQNVVNAVGGNIVVKKEMVLDELHIYGSSRHGIHKPSVTLVNKTYKLNNIDSATDSTQAHLSYKYFKRTLTYKQYELTNHLGNVLATVLDRKTFVGDDTLEYYQADVYTAGLYYAFGGGIEEMQYKSDTSNSYRYGFNNQEKDDELAGEGNSYTAEFWQYDGRLGRRFNIDPRPNPSISVYACLGNNPIWFTDALGDTIRITNSSGGYTQYAPGMDYNGYDEFVCETVTALNKLYNGGDVGKELVNNLHTMKNISKINYSEDETYALGYNIFWNPNNWDGGLDQLGYTDRDPFISLGHEMAHVWDYKNGITKNILGVGFYDVWFMVGDKKVHHCEKYACHIENKLRAEHNFPLRTHYSYESIYIVNTGESKSGIGAIINGNESIFFKSTTTLIILSTFEFEDKIFSIIVNKPFNYKNDKLEQINIFEIYEY